MTIRERHSDILKPNKIVTIEDLNEIFKREDKLFEEGKPSLDMAQLYQMYGPEGLLSILNEYVSAEPIQNPDDIPSALSGGKIKLDINKRLGIDVDKLPPIPIGSRGLKKYAKKNPLAVAALGKNPFRVAGSPPKDLLG